tara:strand:- start:253 stop:543 length:291 start_codon:yes stop_codon:yes gene_type:complete
MKFNKKYGQKLGQPNSKEDISRLTGIPIKILDEAFYRGKGAFKTNRAAVRPSIKSADAWGYGRVYALAMKGKNYRTADSDLAKKIIKLKIKGYTKA